MSRIKLMVLMLFSVVAVSAVASGSASAACSGGTKSVWCDHTGTEITNELVLGTSGLSLLVGRAGGGQVKIHCKDDTFHGFLLKLGTGEGTITYLGCTVVEPAGCGVTQPILAQVTTSLTEGIMPPTGLFKGAGTGEKFTEITITTCAIAGGYPVTGSQTVELPGGETFLTNHEIVAKKTGSNLKFGTEAATYSGTALIHLNSLLPWGTRLGI
jgi:hypothetical protein